MAVSISQQIIDKLDGEIFAEASPVVGTRKFTTHEDTIRGIDALSNSIAMPEVDTQGYCFTTRPRCNLSTPSIREDEILSLVDTFDIDSVQYAVRALLDTDLDVHYPSVRHNAAKFFDHQNPFIPILTNRLENMSGWPDPVLETETSDAGFFGETITMPKGHDQLSKAYTLTSSYADIQGNFIMSLFLIYLRYLERVTRGVTVQYLRDREMRRMGFTVSQYRFVMDPSKKYITKWSKATGCFPQSNALGKYFNFDRKADGHETNKDVTIPWSVAGNIRYFRPSTLLEFNTLVERYCPTIKDQPKVSSHQQKIDNNYKCIPYINLEDGTNELEWRLSPTVSDSSSGSAFSNRNL